VPNNPTVTLSYHICTDGKNSNTEVFIETNIEARLSVIVAAPIGAIWRMNLGNDDA